MNKYIIELLQVRTSLIIPDVGTFLVNKATGTVKFNPLLRFNDNVLVNYIAEKEGVDAKEALNQISKFTREMKAQLDKGESFEIFNLGKLTKNEKGAVTFEAGGKIDSKTPEPKPEIKKEETPKPIVEEKVETPKAEEKIETPKVEEKIEAKIETPKVEEKKETPKVEEKKEDVKNVYIPKKEEDKKTAEVKKETPEKKPVDNKKTKEVKTKEPKKKKKRMGLKIFIILIVLIVGGITAGHFFLHEQTNKILSKAGFTTDDIFGFLDKKEEVKEEPVKEEPITVVEEPIIEEVDTTETIEEPIVEEPIVKNNTSNVQGSTSGSFHIIGNSFGSETNAQKYVSDMQAKGYNSAKILGKFDNLYMVAVKSYNSSSDAQSDLSNVKNDVPKGWIFKHPK